MAQMTYFIQFRPIGYFQQRGRFPFDFLNFAPMNKQRRIPGSDFDTEVKLKGFKAYEIDSKTGKGHGYNRKDFYKISLNTGKYIFHYADRSFETDETILFFGNPHIPYSCEVISKTNEGYASLFTEDFLKMLRKGNIYLLPIYRLI